MTSSPTYSVSFFIIRPDRLTELDSLGDYSYDSSPWIPRIGDFFRFSDRTVWNDQDRFGWVERVSTHWDRMRVYIEVVILELAAPDESRESARMRFHSA